MKHPLLINLTDEGMVIISNDLQFEKHRLLIELTRGLIVILFNALQSINTCS